MKGHAIAFALASAVVPVQAGAQEGSIELQITLERNSEREQSTAAQLNRTLQKYEIGKWIYTRRVHIAEGVIPHSHPVLTLHTRHLGDEHGLLATFIHEQLHWLEEGNANFRAAMDNFTDVYPNAPAGGPEGARDLESTYRHLLVCDLEFQVMTVLVGEVRAREVLSANRHYTWIYDRVLNDPRVRQITAAHGFAFTAPDTSGIIERHEMIASRIHIPDLTNAAQLELRARRTRERSLLSNACCLTKM